VALIFYFVNLVQKIKNQDYYVRQISAKSSYYKDEADKKLIEGQGNYWLGSANPKLTIVEFGDFDCPYCENSYSKIREISVKYKDSVKIIYRDFPNHENSTMKAMSARCAGEQGLFWPMHDKLFQNQAFATNEEILSLALLVGADSKRFTDCMATNKHLPTLQKDYLDAETLGVKGTPVWYFNGYRIEGDIPYDSFIKIVEEMIK
jgi:protein-disulfide isomerase